MTVGPPPVRRIDRVWVPMPDGRRLAGRLWLPVAAGPAPVVLEAHPYRSADLSAIGDDARYRFLAEAGIAGLRVDLAGTGDSDGFLDDEYLARELDDMVDAIAWAADQSWCTGAVGVQGISWGGFNALQVGARRPPALGGIISACASDNRYSDDVHYLGGCVIGSEMLSWASTMLALNALPPDPAAVGAQWEAIWAQRVEKARFLAEEWLDHQHRDAYWNHGSVDVDYAAIDCPVFLVGGWADGYRDGALRLAAALTGPVRLLIGPWGHGWPGELDPGAPVDFGAEVLTWWKWCLGADGPTSTGRSASPDQDQAVRVWLADPDPGDFAVQRSGTDPGRGSWLTAARWPLPSSDSAVWALRGSDLVPPSDPAGDEGGASSDPASAEARRIPAPVSPVSYAGPWCGAGRSTDQPGDQRAEDDRWLSFTSPPLDEELVLVGAPAAELSVRADGGLAMVAVRLCQVAEDGRSVLVTRGLLNLTHRISAEFPQPLTPGTFCRATVRLQSVARRVQAGSRLRMCLASAYWPLTWPSPRPVSLDIDPSRCQLMLPVVASAGASESLSGRARPAARRGGIGFEVLPAPSERTDLAHRADDGRTVVEVARGGPTVRLDNGRAFGIRGSDTFVSVGDDPKTVEAASARSISLSDEGWAAEVTVQSRMWSDQSHFHLECRLEAVGGERTALERSFRTSIARRWS